MSNGISAATDVTRVQPSYSGAMPASTGDAPPSLLPPPIVGTQGLDAMGLLYACQAKDRELGLSQGESSIHVQQAAKQEALRQQIDAIQKAAEAAQHHSFWDDVGNVCATVGKVCAIVGSVAVAVVSCGAAAPIAAFAIAGCVLSCAGMAEGECHVLEKLGVDPDVAGYVGIGLSFAGALCSGGAGLAASGGTAVTAFAKGASVTASVVGGAAQVGAGTSKIVSSQYQGDELDREADAKQAQLQAQIIQRGIESLISSLGDDDKQAQRRLEYTQGAIQGQDAALHAAVRES